MRYTRKMTLAALASLALLPTSASAAYTVKGPHPGTVTALTYFSDGSFHGAVDVKSDKCNYWGVQTGVMGSLYWNVIIATTYVTCGSGSGSGNANEARHHWASGWNFRIFHFVKTDASVDKTCDRCQVGDEGEKTHFQYDLSGTKDTSWYAGYTSKGEFVDRTETLGVLD